MAILHVIPTLEPTGGGVPAVVAGLASAQHGLGQTVRIASYAGPDTPSAMALLHEQRGGDEVDADFCEATGLAAARPGGAMQRWLGPRIEAADVVHLHGVWEPLLLSAAALCRRTKTPYLLAPHGMLDPWSLTQKKLKKRVFLTLFHRRMLNGAAALHVLNEDEGRLIEPLGLRCPPVTLPNGIDFDQFDPPPEPGRFRSANPAFLQDDPYMLFMSRLHYKKGLDVLIDAFGAYRRSGGRAKLIVAGPDGGYGSTLDDRIAAQGLGAAVRAIGPVYGVQKLEMLRDAAAFVLPSRQEGFSMAITEAMAMGLPVVITPECHFPEVAEQGAGLIVERDPARFAEAFARLDADPDAATALGASARRLVADRYTWPAIAARSLSIYRDLTPSRSHSEAED
ncbi:MAG: glycosyltransferase [Planctomycetota bacterium]